MMTSEGKNFSFISNTQKIISFFEQKRSQAAQVMTDAMRKGMQLYHSVIVENQMSGRRADDYGLNRRTGFLVRSWSVKTNRSGANSSVVLSTRCAYAAIHEYGGVIKHPKGYEIRIPQRLHIREEYKTTGYPGIVQEVQSAIQTLIGQV